MKFLENQSTASGVVPCGRTEGRTDMTKLTAAVRNFANAPKNAFCVPPKELTLRQKWAKLANSAMKSPRSDKNSEFYERR